MGSHLEGNKGVEIQGTVIRNMKDLKIIAPDGDIKIEGVKILLIILLIQNILIICSNRGCITKIKYKKLID